MVKLLRSNTNDAATMEVWEQIEQLLAVYENELSSSQVDAIRRIGVGGDVSSVNDLINRILAIIRV